MRFPEVARIAAKAGCIAMIYPGAFNMVTGPLHWELLQRARAVDHQAYGYQLYVAACSPPVKCPPLTTPGAIPRLWIRAVALRGQVVATTGHEEDIVYADLDPVELASIRQSIPISAQARHDIFQRYGC
ncbi:Omega-amidase nit3 [Massospora cicadina]|nr:Omega-amidase nit3 [Massospora cicadina]